MKTWNVSLFCVQKAREPETRSRKLCAQQAKTGFKLYDKRKVCWKFSK